MSLTLSVLSCPGGPIQHELLCVGVVSLRSRGVVRLPRGTMANSARSIREFFSPANAPPPSRDEGSSESDSTQQGECSELDHQAKRLRSHARQSGFNKDWSSSFPWVVVDGEGMLCRKHNGRPQKAVVGKTTWVDVPCVTMTQNSLKRHGMSLSHSEAKKLEAQLCISARDGGLQQSFTVVESAERKAMKAAMKCLYWLAKQEIPHTTNFVGLLELAKSLGATYLNDLNVGGNAHYTSERFMQEALTSLGEVISKKIFNELRASPYFSLMCDETTDVAVVKEVIIYARYIGTDRKVCTAFIGMMEVSDGTAKTILAALQKLCEKENLDIENKLVAFGSDGAAIMIGSRGGVATLLKQKCPISNHCVAHRLALAAAQAADEVAYVKKIKAILSQLYRFYDYSAVRSAGLKHIQDVLNDPRLKLTKALDVRWLSHEKAVENLRKCLPSVITSLEREASEMHDAQALGLATFVKSYNFVATLLMLADVLPHHCAKTQNSDVCCVR